MPNISDDRLKIWLDFCKFIFVSGIIAAVIAIAPPLINSQIQDKELKIKEAEQQAKLKIAKEKNEADIQTKVIEQETQYVKSFIDKATEENIENRYRFTHYISSLTRDPVYREGWRSLFVAVERERKAVQEKLVQAEKAALGKSGAELNNAQSEVARLKSELQTKSRSPGPARPAIVSYGAISSNAPCPENTQMIISAFESDSLGSFSDNPFGTIRIRKVTDADLAYDPASARIATQITSGPEDFIVPGTLPFWDVDKLAGTNSSFLFKYWLSNSRFLFLGRHCIDKEGKAVGDTAIFSYNGKFVGNVKWSQK